MTGWISKPKRLLKLCVSSLLLLLGVAWAVGVFADLTFDDGDGARMGILQGNWTYRGGLRSFTTVAYTLVPWAQVLQGRLPQPTRPDDVLMRQLHVFPPRGLSYTRHPTPTWGNSWYWRSDPCGSFLRCKCSSPNPRSTGFWVLTACVPTWAPFAVVGIATFYSFRSAIFNRKQRGHCPTCHYNLTGNTSGICPECGTACQIEKA